MNNLNRHQLRELENCYLKVQANVWAKLEAVRQRIKELKEQEEQQPISEPQNTRIDTNENSHS